jgi:hypothetical protein
MTYTNSHILDPNPGVIGFVVDNGKYAAIPIVGNDKKLMVIYNDCKSMKVCRNKQSAINFIEKERKRKNKS